LRIAPALAIVGALAGTVAAQPLDPEAPRTHEVKPAFGHFFLGALGTSTRDFGNDRRSGLLVAAEASYHEGKRSGPAAEVGAALGYMNGGFAAELRAGIGAGLRLGPVGVTAVAGGLISVLGDDDSLHDFTRHAGVLLGTRAYLRLGDVGQYGLTVAAAQTAGKNADQLRLEAWLGFRHYQLGVRWISHGERFEERVASTIELGFGVGL
jgi:hypothetical protein